MPCTYLQFALKTNPVEAPISVCYREKPDVVYLQEVIHKTQELLIQMLPSYQCITGSNGRLSYFNVTLLRKDTTKYLDHSVLPFHSSTQGRHLIKIKVNMFTVYLNNSRKEKFNVLGNIVRTLLIR